MQERWWYSKHQVVKTFIKGNTGLLLVMVAQLFFAVMDVSVKQLHSLDEPVPTLELIFVRMSMTYILCMTYMWARSVPDPFLGPKGVRLLLVLRGIFGFFGLFGIYYSLQYLSLSDATVLTFLTPSLTAIVAAVFLGEKLSLKIIAAGYLLQLGKSVIRTGYPLVLMIRCGIRVAIIGAVGAAGAYTTIAAIGKRSHAAHSMAYFSLMCSIVSPIGMLVTRTPFVIPTQTEWIVLFLVIGTFGFFGQMLLITGFQREAAGRASMGIYLLVVFALIFERYIFHVQPPLLSIAGIVIILGCAIFIAVRLVYLPVTFGSHTDYTCS
ncbi:uncharacterized protein STEHIDRAFT_62256 [Stereum hirsutum FP-91666 SS1]|uniref:uncharacterized protein n=1 Tax=Stereum hirsutum (strain FP-91666) TaxID=721885 RepID=UPI0004449A88|nr:uncharacterized protein STEHIDRAFT_62256 [Stereum hirsutum FP-91666 SS1]EIM83818.1 hypothetical protein STEHIDRAFT_62256 [Stereum hirsutum FP-91666 SS1]